MYPTIGPMRYYVPAANVSLAGGATLALPQWRWPRPLFVTSFGLATKAGSRPELANVRIRIQDESFADIFTDGDGLIFEGTGLALAGTMLLTNSFTPLVVVRPFVLQRPVAAGDLWFVTLRNTSGAAIIPELWFDFEEGTK